MQFARYGKAHHVEARRSLQLIAGRSYDVGSGDAKSGLDGKFVIPKALFALFDIIPWHA